MTSKKYLEASSEIYCDRMVNECSADAVIVFDSQGDCEAFVNGFGAMAVAACDFDGKAAKDCIKETKDASCADLAAGKGTPSCDAVYSGACESDSDTD